MEMSFVKLIDLPSRYLPYGVTPGSIEIREMVGRDEEILAEMNTTNIDKKLLKLLSTVIRGIDPSELTLGDRLYCLLWLSINSHGSIFPIEYICKHCYLTSVTDVDLNSYPIKYLDTLDNGELDLGNGDLVKMRLFTAGDAVKVSDQIALGSRTHLFGYALTIVDNRSIDDRVEWLRNLPVKTLDKIKKYHLNHVHGPVTEFAYTCQHCGGSGVHAGNFCIEWLLG